MDRNNAWTASQLRQLRQLFPHRATAEVAAEVGHSVEATKKKAGRLGLAKSKRYMKSLGRA